MMDVELNFRHGDSAPAWIERVTFPTSGLSIFYRRLELRCLMGGGVSCNCIDGKTVEELWVSGVKRNGPTRQWAGSGTGEVVDNVRDEHEVLVAQRLLFCQFGTFSLPADIDGGERPTPNIGNSICTYQKKAVIPLANYCATISNGLALL